MKSLGDLDQKKSLEVLVSALHWSSDILLEVLGFLCTKVIKYDMQDIDPKLKNSLQPHLPCPNTASHCSRHADHCGGGATQCQIQGPYLAIFSKWNSETTVDGRNPANQLKLVVYPSW